MKLVFGDDKGNCFQKELDESASAQLFGKQIGDPLDGGLAGLPGYELEITGGSNRQGTPMRSTIQGQRKTRVLTGAGVGARKLRPGERVKKLIAGNTVSPATAQVNAKIIKAGPKALKELGFASKKEAETKAAEAPEQEAKPAEKEAPKEEAKPEAPKPEETPKEEEPAKQEAPKEEAKPEAPKAEPETPKQEPEAEAPQEAKPEETPSEEAN